jgi:hypothetical protein
MGIQSEGSFDKQDFRIACSFNRWAPGLNAAANYETRIVFYLCAPCELVLIWHYEKIYGKQLPVVSVPGQLQIHSAAAHTLKICRTMVQ